MSEMVRMPAPMRTQSNVFSLGAAATTATTASAVSPRSMSSHLASYRNPFTRDV
jgi:hypothetical protein